MSKVLLFWLALSLWTVAANANSDILAPGDFAEGIHVTPAGETAAQYFEIPYMVYEGVTRNDRSDFAVFDAHGNAVPRMIRKAWIASSTEITRELPMFPVHAGRDEGLEDLSLKIERNADGTLVDIQSAGGADRAGSRLQKVAYLFDLQPVGESVDGLLGELVFDWSDSATDSIWHVTLDGSEDLENWETLAFDAVLTELDYGGQTLIKNNVSILPVADIKYLRMRWPEGQVAPELTRVTAKFQSHKTRAEWRTRSFKLTPYENTGDKAVIEGYTFSTGGFVPVEKFSIELPDGNSLYKGKLYSRIDERDDWTLRGEFLQYRLRTHETPLVSDEQAVHLTTDPQWLVSFEEPGINGGVQLPDVRIGWQAEYLHFLALGEAPFTLAYGNASGGVAEYSSDTLKKISAENAQGDAAKLGAPFVLGGEQKRLLPEKPLPWRTILLWMVLLAGVVLMTWMALNLYRQMNRPEGGQD